MWAFLYVSISLAAARVANLPDTSQALVIWTVQFTLNTLWSGVFFGLQRTATGGIVISALWVAVCTTMIVFCRKAVKTFAL